MNKLVNASRRLLADEEGVTAIEYGLIAALIAVAIIAGTTLVGTELNDHFTDVSEKLNVTIP